MLSTSYLIKKGVIKAKRMKMNYPKKMVVDLKGHQELLIIKRLKTFEITTDID